MLGGEDKKYNQGYIEATQRGNKKRNPNLGTRKYNPAGEGNGQQAMNSNPNLTAAVAAGQQQGFTGGDLDRFLYGASGFINPSSPTAGPPVAPPAPTGPGGPGSGSGDGGSGAAAAKMAAAKAAVASLFQMYNKPADTALNDQLTKITGQAQATGDTAMSNLRQSLGSYGSPTAPQFQATAVDANPLAAYMQAGGVDSSGTEALRNLLQSTNAQSAQAANTATAAQQASYGQMQNERMQDVAMSEASFRQQLANSQSSMEVSLAAQEKKRKEDMMMNILQMAVTNGLDLGSLGVTF